MKKIVVLIISLALVFSFGAISFAQTEKGVSNAPAGKKAAETKAQYRARAEERLKKIDDKITGLKDKSSTATGAEKTRIDKDIKSLEKKRDAARKDLDKLETSKTKSEYQKVKTKLNNALTALERDVKRAIAKVKGK